MEPVKVARVPGYRVAGKTGTARIAGKDGYKDRRYTASFMGLRRFQNQNL